MLLKNDGAIMAELLLSLSALLMISLFFVPLWTDISKQTRKLQTEKYAQQLVYEELEAFIINGKASPNHSIVQNGVVYEIYWSNAAQEQVKVCVKVEKSTSHPEINICGLSE